jgi:hypothetical protein
VRIFEARSLVYNTDGFADKKREKDWLANEAVELAMGEKETVLARTKSATECVYMRGNSGSLSTDCARNIGHNLLAKAPRLGLIASGLGQCHTCANTAIVCSTARVRKSALDGT